MKKKYEDMTIAEGLISSLEQAIDYEKGIKVKGVKSNTVTVAPLTHYKGNRVKEIRNKAGLTQSTFAYAIGVSIKTVEAWESGKNEPQGPAQRILYILEKDHKFLEKYKLVVNV